MEIIIGLVAVVLSVLVLGLVSVTVTKQISGLVFGSSSVTVSDSDGVQANPTIPVAQPAVLTTRTNGTSGSLTMTNSSHGITTGARVDLYWTGGHCYGATVGTVSGTTVPIASVSGGTALPIATTAITVGICTSAPFAVTGDNVQALVMVPGTAGGYFVFNNGSSDVYAQYAVANQPVDWETGSAGTNPLAGATPTVVYVSHPDTAASHTDMQAAAVYH